MSDHKVNILTPADLEKIASEPDIQIVDVRLPFDFFGGRVPRSINIPGKALASSGGAIPFGRKLVVVCDDGQASLETAEAAVAAGFTDVSVLDGGLDAWIDADLPIETVSDGIPSPLSLKVGNGE